MHPYNPEYFSATSPGSNCLKWNMFLDFGAWQIGDMGAHTMDLAWQAIDADLPITAEATGDPWNPEVAPSDHHATFTFPANSWRGEITLEWFQGNIKPEMPHSAVRYYENWSWSNVSGDERNPYRRFHESNPYSQS
jgi:hypothetical protein